VEKKDGRAESLAEGVEGKGWEDRGRTPYLTLAEEVGESGGDGMEIDIEISVDRGERREEGDGWRSNEGERKNESETKPQISCRPRTLLLLALPSFSPPPHEKGMTRTDWTGFSRDPLRQSETRATEEKEEKRTESRRMKKRTSQRIDACFIFPRLSFGELHAAKGVFL